MLNTVYRDAVLRRDEMLSALRGPAYERILRLARESWTEFTPTRDWGGTAAGIDGSFNSARFQGIELWAATAVSVRTDGEILSDRHDCGLGPDRDMSAIASRMEIDACEETVDAADLVLMDGSLHSQFMTRQAGLDRRITEAMGRRGNVAFVSKTSTTRERFGSAGSMAGDIFYYNRATSRPGFSRVHVEDRYGAGREISSTFARLGDSTPIIKVELLGDGYGAGDMREVLNRMSATSVGGYPYELKLAHNSCKVSGGNLARMTSLLGLGNEVGSREVLGE